MYIHIKAFIPASVFFGRVGVSNAIDFALETFQRIFTRILILKD